LRHEPLAEPDGRTWGVAARRLLAKLLAELSFEELLQPEPTGPPNRYGVRLDQGIEYRFGAVRDSFGSWVVDPASLVRRSPEHEEPAADPLQFVVDARRSLGFSGVVTAELVRELTATLAADVALLQTSPSAAELAELPYAELEGHLTGHPCMVLSKGRLGFSASDIARYAPESRNPFRLLWIAVDEGLASYQAVPGLTRELLLAGELGEDTLRRFQGSLAARGMDPSTRILLPVHPWQCDEVVVPLFAPQLADGRIAVLGDGPDRYLPLQSVRTLTNVDMPRRRDVKLPLLVRNTLVWRGLDMQATAAAPEVTRWLCGIRERDSFLHEETRIALLGEVASVTVPHPVLERVPEAPYRYHELLGAVWRSPLQHHLGLGETGRSMASLLHVDRNGRALLAELVERSGLPARAWLSTLLAALLRPLLHYLYRYGVAFCPHGENTVVLYDDHDRPVGIALKDFAEDVNLARRPLPEYGDLPPRAAAALLRWEPEDLCHSILSAVFAGQLRFLVPLAREHLGIRDAELWGIVRRELRAYQVRFPELAERFTMFDLRRPAFGRICLNREHLLGGGFHERAERDESFDLVHGTVANPAAW
jgi:siderophore synthetase component